MTGAWLFWATGAWLPVWGGVCLCIAAVHLAVTSARRKRDDA